MFWNDSGMKPNILTKTFKPMQQLRQREKKKVSGKSPYYVITVTELEGGGGGGLRVPGLVSAH
jgi:hypothetical protein